MERMMSWPIDEVLEGMASYHVGIMDLGRSNSESGRGYLRKGAHKYSPYIDEDKENKVHETM